MKYIYLLCLAATIIMLLGLVSCKKYLDKKSDTSLLVPQNLDELQKLLDDDNRMNLSITPSFGEVSADDYFLTDDNYNSVSEDERKAYAWTLSVYNFSNDWSTNYTPIYNANYCLEQVEKIQKTAQNTIKWDNIKGASLFYRAYYFLNLSWVFAKAYDESSANTDLGIVLRLGSNFNVPSTRASVKESYDQIIKDTKESVSYLPDNSQHVMRPSKAAAYGLLARTYLTMRKYDSALKYSNLCLQIKNQLLDYNAIDDIYGFSVFPQFNNTETIFYTEMGFLLSNIGNWVAAIDSSLYNSYNDDDLRKNAFFFSNFDYQSFKGSYSGTDAIYFTGLAIDEMYLIRSECLARKNDKDAALNDLNTLLSNRWSTGTFSPITAATAQDALKTILTERRKELVMRGLRWSDIKRLNKEGANITLKRIVNSQQSVLAPNDKRFALPLPDDIIRQTGMQQN